MANHLRYGCGDSGRFCSGKLSQRRKKSMSQAQTTSREPTMEEILASIRRIIEDSNAAKVEPEPEEIAQEVEMATPQPFDNVEPVIEAEVASFEREFAEADVFERPVQEAIVSRDAQSVSPVLAAAAAVEADPAYVEPVREPFRELKPIISEAASREVAKSFEHLQVALHEERSTSVADMTEDMLRPLLQDWLDNNLPTMVERSGARRNRARFARALICFINCSTAPPAGGVLLYSGAPFDFKPRRALEQTRNQSFRI